MVAFRGTTTAVVLPVLGPFGHDEKHLGQSQERPFADFDIHEPVSQQNAAPIGGFCLQPRCGVCAKVRKHRGRGCARPLFSQVVAVVPPPFSERNSSRGKNRRACRFSPALLAASEGFHAIAWLADVPGNRARGPPSSPEGKL